MLLPEILKNYPLKKHNTFGIDVRAKKYVEISDIQELTAVLSMVKVEKDELMILGGGSNILFTKNFEGLVIKNSIHGIEILSENKESIILKIGAGELWHSFVLHCIKHGYGGVENLSLIPGTVGAAPMQNIGAYGVEIKDVFLSLEALNRETLKIEKFDSKDCQFGYRQSVFKTIHKDKYIIVNVSLALSKRPMLNTSYGAIQDTLNARGISDPTIKDVSDAVISIRRSKLPDPEEIGNAGSFFKNPEIEKCKFENLAQQFPAIPSYELPNNMVKVPAAWLIEQCGWKGKTIGTIGVHKKQALVLVNHNNGQGNDIHQLALDIQKSVREYFDISLEMEVNVL